MKAQTKQKKLEKQRNVFFLVGMIVALGLVLTAFEWRTYDYSVKEVDRYGIDWNDEDRVLPTQHKKPTPPPPPVKSIVRIKEVDNTVEVIDVEIFDPESGEEVEIQEFIYTMPEEPEEGQQMDFFLIPEQKPEFPGGEKAMMEYFASTITFTKLALEAGIDGVVHVGFVVEKDGSISSVEVKRGPGAGLNEIAVQAVKSMPRWIPGKQRGVPVRVPMVVPIKFELQ